MLEDFMAVDDSSFKTLLSRSETHDIFAHSPLDNPLQANESAAANEKDVGGVHTDIFLLRMLAPALGRDVANGPFQNLQQRLLNAFTRDVSRDGNILGLTGDFINLINI